MKKNMLLLALTIITMSAAHADDATISKKLHDFGLKQVEISDSPIAGMRSVVTEQGIFYASEDGKYYLQGNLVELTDKGPVDLSNRPLLPKLEALQKEMILFPAKDEKYNITVFFDTSCHYCQLLHKDIEKLNAKGITVRYLAFPRNGMNNKIARQMETVFSTENKIQALNDLEGGKAVPETRVDKVKKHYELGSQFGVQGTPAIITPKGLIIQGYRNPDEILEILEAERLL
ncbi:MAG: bifunctional protein-disulfide isomerase/oxidoreductase DsbC [Cardiobacteriaceae bacterium]|nr:bifunctional protein-disulfide isomerase/oxidoreductase DsbC [Cardiobacteriaceae bacterium]